MSSGKPEIAVANGAPAGRCISNPLLDTTTGIKRISKWLFGVPGFFSPWFAIYMIVIGISYLFFTPALSRMETLSVSWIFKITARNVVLNRRGVC